MLTGQHVGDGRRFACADIDAILSHDDIAGAALAKVRRIAFRARGDESRIVGHPPFLPRDLRDQHLALWVRFEGIAFQFGFDVVGIVDAAAARYEMLIDRQHERMRKDDAVCIREDTLSGIQPQRVVGDSHRIGEIIDR